jgi:hypothetical protein
MAWDEAGSPRSAQVTATVEAADEGLNNPRAQEPSSSSLRYTTPSGRSVTLRSNRTGQTERVRLQKMTCDFGIQPVPITPQIHTSTFATWPFWFDPFGLTPSWPV